MAKAVALLLVCCSCVDAYASRVASRAAVRMEATKDRRPKTVDPLGEAFGRPEERERSYEYWLDLRTAENTFAQMVVVKLFYATRRVVDEAGRALPKGAAVQGLFFAEDRFDRADTIGQDVPVFLESASGVVSDATNRNAIEELASELRAPQSADELVAAQAELTAVGESASEPLKTAIALPADPLLWAMALTGLEPAQLECLEGNEGA